MKQKLIKFVDRAKKAVRAAIDPSWEGVAKECADEADKALDDLLAQETATLVSDETPEPTIFITEVKVRDPLTHEEVEIELHYDPTSKGIIGIDSSFADRVSSKITSPLSGKVIKLSEPEATTEEEPVSREVAIT